MNEPTFTKGPWHAFEQNGSNPKTKGLFAITAPHESGSQQTVAVTPFAGDGNELWANARLIAAAPEMLSILQDILIKCPVNGYRGKYDHSKTYQARKRARELLAKVEGEK
jgi:hypothetical protein